MTSFLEFLQFQARSRPHAPALMTLRATLSYEELMGRVRSVTRYFADSKLNRGDVLVLNLTDPLQHCCAIVGAMAAGITTLSVAGVRPVLPNKLTVHAILTDQPPGPSPQARVLRVPP